LTFGSNDANFDFKNSDVAPSLPCKHNLQKKNPKLPTLFFVKSLLGTHIIFSPSKMNSLWWKI